MSDNLSRVREWHEAFNCPVSEVPVIGMDSDAMRVELIREEFEELRTAVEAHDLIEVADALADLLYVVYGAALTWGIPLNEVFAEVHRSNMTKLGADGKPVMREDGKVLKGPGYERPNIAPLLTQPTSPDTSVDREETE